MSDLDSLVRMIESNVGDLDEMIEKLTIGSLEDVLDARAILATTAMGFTAVREALDSRIGDAMGEYRVVVEGHGVVERHRKKSRTKWDKDLIRAVLDSRVVDETTGEVLDETQLDKVTAVWNLGVPRVTALRARNIDPDEWCETEERSGWQLKVG